MVYSLPHYFPLLPIHITAVSTWKALPFLFLPHSETTEHDCRVSTVFHAMRYECKTIPTCKDLSVYHWEANMKTFKCTKVLYGAVDRVCVSYSSSQTMGHDWFYGDSKEGILKGLHNLLKYEIDTQFYFLLLFLSSISRLY